MNRSFRISKGFTIVELLIVIVVIGILAAITIVAYNGIQERTRISVAKTDMRNMYTHMKLKVVDGQTIYNSTWVDSLQKTGLYEATRPNQSKSFALCWNEATGDMALVAFAPVKANGSVNDGDTLIAYTSAGVTEITYLVANGSLVSSRSCTTALPGFTHHTWTFNIS